MTIVELKIDAFYGCLSTVNAINLEQYYIFYESKILISLRAFCKVIKMVYTPHMVLVLVLDWCAIAFTISP